jgi:hypothetical protein
MSAARYTALCAYAGEWLAEPLRQPFDLDDLAGLHTRTGVYIICEPLECVQYVGSVRRPSTLNGVAIRLREHAREGVKRLYWKKAWIIPMKDDAPLATVRLVEGCVGTELLPLGGDRLPRIV